MLQPSRDSRTATASPSVAATTVSPTPTPTLVSAVEYGSLADLKEAAVTAGYSCPQWDQDDQVTLAAESGSCSDADVFATYVTDSDLQDQIDQYKENNEMLEESGIDASTILVGPNWTVSGDEKPVQALRKGIGGKILR